MVLLHLDIENCTKIFIRANKFKRYSFLKFQQMFFIAGTAK